MSSWFLLAINHRPRIMAFTTDRDRCEGWVDYSAAISDCGPYQELCMVACQFAAIIWSEACLARQNTCWMCFFTCLYLSTLP
jgi:hypothetical protein